MKTVDGKAQEVDILIVGAGHNGLVAGGYLARSGLEVQVLERRSLVGGACVTEELFPGFHFSSCSFMLYALHPRIAEDLELHRYGFEVFQLEPFAFRPYPDGRHLVLHQESERNAEEIGAFSRRDGESYRRWNRFWERFDSIVHPYVLTPPPTHRDLARRARETGNEEIYKKVLTTSHADLVEEFFESEHVRAAVINSGDHGDPRSVGSALPAAFLPGDVEPERRIVGIVKGGMGSVTRAMAGYLKSQGGTIRTGCEVRRVLVEDGRAQGVELTSGETIRSRLVVSNADPKRTFLRLVEPQHLPAGFRRRVRGRRTEIGYFKFHAAMNELPDFSSYLGTDYDPRITTRVWICPSIDHVRRAWRDARRGRPSRQPVMSIQIPSIYDRSICPPGKHVLSIFAEYAPVRLARGNWDERREQAGEVSDRRGCGIRSQLSGGHRGLDAPDAARPGAPRLPDRRQHPPPGHDTESGLLTPAAHRLGRIQDSHPGPVALRRRHPPGRRSLGSARSQCGPRHPAGSGGRGDFQSPTLLTDA